MITLALYPYMSIVLGHADFSTPIVRGSRATMGDITIVATCIFISVYLHELLYVSGDVQWVSVVHHVGAVVVAAVMVTRNVRWEVEANTTAYTVLIMTYGIVHPPPHTHTPPGVREGRSADEREQGIFDILAGLWPRPVLLSRTIWPQRHRVNMWFCYAAVVLTGLGTVGETIVALYMYGVNFQGWSTPIQVVTPVCHVVFMLAQIYSSRIMWVLARKHRGMLRRRDEEERVVVEAEEAVETVERGKQPGGAADACASGGLVGQ